MAGKKIFVFKEEPKNKAVVLLSGLIASLQLAQILDKLVSRSYTGKFGRDNTLTQMSIQCMACGTSFPEK